jgi:DNA helicase-2/ATP-dependent DNA helicase PcrA
VPAIADFARTMELPGEPPADPAVWASPCDGPLAQAAQLCWHLDALLTRDPWRQIAVIARNPEHARRLHAELARGVDSSLVLDGDFRFEPGVIVTTATAVSGLEFDAVIIPDLAPAFYPAGSAELARALYVAATRAREWLWLLSPAEWSPLVIRTPP